MSDGARWECLNESPLLPGFSEAFLAGRVLRGGAHVQPSCSSSSSSSSSSSAAAPGSLFMAHSDRKKRRLWDISTVSCRNLLPLHVSESLRQRKGQFPVVNSDSVRVQTHPRPSSLLSQHQLVLLAGSSVVFRSAWSHPTQSPDWHVSLGEMRCLPGMALAGQQRFVVRVLGRRQAAVAAAAAEEEEEGVLVLESLLDLADMVEVDGERMERQQLPLNAVLVTLRDGRMFCLPGTVRCALQLEQERQWQHTHPMVGCVGGGGRMARSHSMGELTRNNQWRQQGREKEREREKEEKRRRRVMLANKERKGRKGKVSKNQSQEKEEPDRGGGGNVFPVLQWDRGFDLMEDGKERQGAKSKLAGSRSCAVLRGGGEEDEEEDEEEAAVKDGENTGDEVGDKKTREEDDKGKLHSTASAAPAAPTSAVPALAPHRSFVARTSAEALVASAQFYVGGATPSSPSTPKASEERHHSKHSVEVIRLEELQETVWRIACVLYTTAEVRKEVQEAKKEVEQRMVECRVEESLRAEEERDRELLRLRQLQQALEEMRARRDERREAVRWKRAELQQRAQDLVEGAQRLQQQRQESAEEEAVARSQRRKESWLAMSVLRHRRADMVRELVWTFMLTPTSIGRIDLVELNAFVLSASPSSKERDLIAAGLGMMCDFMQFLRKYCEISWGYLIINGGSRSQIGEHVWQRVHLHPLYPSSQSSRRSDFEYGLALLCKSLSLACSARCVPVRGGATPVELLFRLAQHFIAEDPLLQRD